MPRNHNDPITRRELLESGVPARAIEMMRRRGQIRPMFRGVYVPGDADDTPELRARAAALVLNDRHIVCDRSAAYIHGADVYGSRESTDRRLETCVRRGGTRTRQSAIDGRQRDLAPTDIRVFFGARLTTPLRTALDLGCSVPRHRALGAMDQLARLHGFDRSEMERAAGRFRGRRGVVQLRELIRLVDPRSESPRESWIRLDIDDAGLPAPELQYWVIEDGREIYRLDLAYPAHRVAVEYDGEEFHARSEAQIQADIERRAWLRQRGWLVIVVTKADIGPDALWIRQLREALQPQTRRFRWELGREK